MLTEATTSLFLKYYLIRKNINFAKTHMVFEDPLQQCLPGSKSFVVQMFVCQLQLGL